VLRAGSIAEAQNHIRNSAPEVAVVDINLASGETGPDFVDRIHRELGQRLPALVLTGATDAETLSRLVESGWRWMTKPADPDAIASVLAELASAADSEAPADGQGREVRGRADNLLAAE
jgi:two-component system, sensor histidine kinase